MNTDSANLHANRAARCLYRTPTGRQCSFNGSPATAGLCARHAALEEQSQSADFSSLLAAGGRNAFQSAESINRSLAELHALLAKDLISPRRAAVLAYIASLLLRTLPGIQEEAAGAAPQNRPVKIIFDMPHPAHEDVQKQS